MQRRLSLVLKGWENESYALGGWSLDAVHSYDVVSGTLYRGDGTQRQSDALGTVRLLAPPSSQLGGGTTLRDGSTLVSYGGRVDRIHPDGTTEVFASSDATSSAAYRSGLITGVQNLVEASDGAIYATAFNARWIIRIADGTVKIVGGNPENPWVGDNQSENIPALGASVRVGGMALAPDGSIYFIELSQHRIRRIGPDGMLNTVNGWLPPPPPRPLIPLPRRHRRRRHRRIFHGSTSPQ